ncbi:hypothetical protein CEXT_248001 [Caerostris extrusa]|uniref:Uncharacterized protein n=1 Tax=Caerostris extrusa TaxID=172846 RepID=A0AAV4TFY5_CAEEX|nr:hypothetical protein CEXT_248001 [Caerostris extrusa]
MEASLLILWNPSSRSALLHWMQQSESALMMKPNAANLVPKKSRLLFFQQADTHRWKNHSLKMAGGINAIRWQALILFGDISNNFLLSDLVRTDFCYFYCKCDIA